MNDELVENVNKKICENHRFTLTELWLCFPQISRTLLHEIFAQKLGCHKLCARCVPKIQTEVHKGQHMTTYYNNYIIQKCFLTNMQKTLFLIYNINIKINLIVSVTAWCL